MRILITGAAGMLGQDVCEAAWAAGHEPTALARAELDITDDAAVHAAVAKARPDAVINCAAWTNVDGAEDELRRRARRQRRRARATWPGPRTPAAPGRSTSPATTCSTDSSSRPTSSRTRWGRSRPTAAPSSQGELEVAQAAPASHTIVRSSWLFGAGGSCFPKTILRLAAERDHLDVVSDQLGCPTFTGHLGAALVTLAARPAARGRCTWPLRATARGLTSRRRS